MSTRRVDPVAAYLAKLPADRRAAIARVREVVNANLPPGFEEGVQHGMIAWYVPLARFPATYNGQPLLVAALASQQRHMAIYLMGVYGDAALAAWFRGAFAAAGKRLDMGKSCVRFASLEALPLEVVGEVIRRVPVAAMIAVHEAAHGGRGAKAPQPAKATRAAKAPPPAKASRAAKAPQPAKASRGAKTPPPAKASRGAKAPQPAKATRAAKTPQPAKAPRAAKTPQPAKASRAAKAPQLAKASRAAKAPPPAKAPRAAKAPQAAKAKATSATK